MAKKIWACVWLAAGLYCVVAAIGEGAGTVTTVAMLCGFMVARNLANVVAT